MALAEQQKQITQHSLVLENRQKLHLTGVKEVERFDEEVVTASLGEESLTIKGSGLKVEKLDVEHGDLFLHGLVESMSYGFSQGSKRSSAIGKLFR